MLYKKVLRMVQAEFKNDRLALLSLVIALGSMSYDIWRDHENQVNFNRRQAAFEILKNLGELQTIVNYAHYNMDELHGNPIDGWKYVLMIHDLSVLLPAPNTYYSEQLFTSWQENWETLKDSSDSERNISTHIAEARKAVVNIITTLE